MEILEKKYDTILRALITLKNIIKKIELRGKNDEDYLELRDSLIKRLEYSIETFWRYLKLYQQDKYQINLDLNGSRTILKIAKNNNLISEDELDTLLQAIGDRNNMAHAYWEDEAEMLVESVPTYYFVMQEVIERIKP
jgi:uncharacterized protein YutE (UPF0331/DUF86 family)